MLFYIFSLRLQILLLCATDPGSAGGPRCTTDANEQGIILLRYLQRWNFISSHPFLCPLDSSYTYESEAHHSFSSIDSIICPRNLLHLFQSCSPPRTNVRSCLHLHRKIISDNLFASLDIDFSDPQCFFCRYAFTPILALLNHLPPGCRIKTMS